MPHLDFYSDTDPAVLQVWFDLYRNMKPEQRVAIAMEQSQRVFALAEANVRKLYPEADNREVQLRVASRHIPRELMMRAYNWDPDLHP